MRFIYLAAAGALNLRSRAFVDFLPFTGCSDELYLKANFPCFFWAKFFSLKDGMNHNTYLVVG